MNTGNSLLATAFFAAVATGLSHVSRAAAPPQLVAVKVAEPPKMNGEGSEKAWQKAKPLSVNAKGVMPKTVGTSTQVTLRAVYTDTNIYVVATWDDATQDDKGHKTWKWDADKKAYVEDADREDMFAVAFEHTGEFTANMLAPVEATWDVWHWKAFRTNPQGYAMDKAHRYTKSQPAGKANKHAATDGSDIWIARPEDGGDSLEKKQAAPTENRGERVPQYLPVVPSGSAADVQAKGTWSNGKWTLEFARKLSTGNADDTAFDTSQTYKMAVSVHDRTGDMDKSSDLVVLRLQK